MEDLIMQACDRLAGGASRGIFKLSEAMGGGKTQSMIACGLLARFPELTSDLPFAKAPNIQKPDAVIVFTGRDTDKNVWVSIGEELGVSFPENSAPSEKQWADALEDKRVLILLDELAFYLVHASTVGKMEEGARFSKRTAIALTNLFGAVRDHKACEKVALVIADLQKDWDQGQEELARIMRSDATLGGTLQSADNEMSKGAVAISPVDNTKDELYAILKKRLFQKIEASETQRKELFDAYFRELDTAKKAGLISQTLGTIRDQMEASYPFHYSTKHLIGTFNDNPGFQKTRDVIRLMASIVRAIWEKGPEEVSQHYLLSLMSANLNDSRVAARFKEVKRSLGMHCRPTSQISAPHTQRA
jgi:predicted AAA+ superfamily ATPase